MKTTLLGFCTLLTFQCFAQNGKFSLQVTQLTDFELECGGFNGLGLGAQAAFKLSSKFSLSTGFNFKQMGQNAHYTYQSGTETPESFVSIGWISKEQVPMVDLPLAIHYQFLQKNKFSMQINAGMRSKFALKRVETNLPDWEHASLSDFPTFSISMNTNLDNPILEEFEFPQFPDFEPIHEDIVIVQEKGYTGIDLFAGFGVAYQVAPFWSFNLNANFNVWGTHQQVQIVNREQTTQKNSGGNLGEMRLSVGLVRHF